MEQQSVFVYNLRWQTSKGFAASLTIRANELDDLLGKAKAAMERLGANDGEASSPPEHFCQEHQTPFQKYEKEGRHWHAHKVGDKWCNEK